VTLRAPDRCSPASVGAGTDDLAEFLGVVALRLGRVTEARTNPPAGPGARAWRRLTANSLYDAWLIDWGTGSGLGLHDHGGSTGAFVVVDGTLVETFRDIDRDHFEMQRLIAGSVVRSRKRVCTTSAIRVAPTRGACTSIRRRCRR
jgi:hypothetical protein